MKLKTLTASIVLACMMLCSCQKTESLIAPENPQNDPSAIQTEDGLAIPLGGNAYITASAIRGSEAITQNGLVGWSSPHAITTAFFRLGQTGNLDVYINAGLQSGTDESVIKVTVNGQSFNVKISGTSIKKYKVGTVEILNAGYVKVDFTGVSKGNNLYFAKVSDIVIEGKAAGPDVIYAYDPATFSTARKGAALQLFYNTPTSNAEWFYNEMTVPPNGYRLGTYYMSNGFTGGHFGMQVNSETDKKIVFTVNDNFSQKATNVRKGTGVTNTTVTGTVTGSQSALSYNWVSGTTYKFLTQGKPDGAGNTIFSSWFYATESAEWKFIASWKRPNTSSYLKNIYSSLEGTNTENSYTVRRARYYNQWVRDIDGTWSEVTNANFDGNTVASDLLRYDFTGGVEYSSFYLKSNGFFPENVELKTQLTRSGTVAPPTVDVNTLP